MPTKTRSPRSATKPDLGAAYVATATGYARDVVEGKVLAARPVRLACKRHLDDLTRSKTAAFPFKVDARKAGRVCAFVEHLPHIKGEWARRREPIHLEPWQTFILVSLFGWVHKRTGLRRFRRAYVEVPRKNAKSTLAAGVGLYMVTADGEHGAEVYCGATTEQQGWEVFRPAKFMVERTAALRTALGVEAHAATIAVANTGSRMEPVIGRPGDGASPSCAIVDEYHEHPTSDLFDTMITGMGARAQPLAFVITTAGVNLEGPCFRMNRELRAVLEGTVEDDELFGVIYTIDDDDDWTTEAALWKANPNAGVSVGIDYLRSQQKQAIVNASRSGVFRTKHLNVWVTARSPYFNVEAWRKCEEAIALDAFAGEPVILFLDLASKKDLAVRVAVFRREGVFYAFPRFWLPRDRVEEVTTAPYSTWLDEGWLDATEGNIIDFAAIEEDLRDLASRFEIKEVAFDPFQATQLATRMGAEGFPMVEYGATVKNFSEPMKQLDALILAGRIRHDGNPVLTWNLGNVVARVDAKDNVYPRKEQPENKIDGAVALIGAMGRWLGAEVDEDVSFFVGL